MICAGSGGMVMETLSNPAFLSKDTVVLATSVDIKSVAELGAISKTDRALTGTGETDCKAPGPYLLRSLMLCICRAVIVGVNSDCTICGPCSLGGDPGGQLVIA